MSDLLPSSAMPTNVPVWADADGGWWTNPLWAKDLLLQAAGCERLILVCPRFPRREPDWVRIEAANLEIRLLPEAANRWIAQLPRLWRTIDGAVRDSEIAYAGVAGWPIPLGWLTTIAARRRQRFLVVNVESAPWRAYDAAARLLRHRVGAALFERHARFCATRADALTVTQPEYLDLAGEADPPAGLFPASWIDEGSIVPAAEAARTWSDKGARLLHAGRLNEAKGTGLLLDAMEALGESAPAVDFIGEGPLGPRCAEAAARSGGRIGMLAPVGYGAAFNALLDRYPAVILPQLSDEQPRLLFDAFARAVPVIASDRAGIRSCMTAEVSGWLFPAGDRDALASLLLRAAAEPMTLRRMGMAALERVAGRTHEAMHRTREDFIRKAMAAR